MKILAFALLTLFLSNLPTWASGGGSAANQPPIAVNDTLIVEKNGSRTIDPSQNDSDPDDDSLTVTGLTFPEHGRVQPLGGNRLSYTPNAGYIGTDRFTYTIVDGQGGSAVGTVRVLVRQRQARPRPAPVARRDEVAVPGNRATSVNVGLNDALDLRPLNVTLTLTNPPEASVSQGNVACTVSLQPLVPGPRQFEFTVQVSDPIAQSSRSSLFVTVSGNEHNISGQVRSAFGGGIAGELVVLSGGASAVQRTDANGRYAFTGLAVGRSYTVQACGTLGFIFEPATRTFGNLQSDQFNQDFQAVPTYTLTAEVRNPTLNLPVPGVTVELLEAGRVIATAVTDANGLAVFGPQFASGLPGNRTYTVRPIKNGTDIFPEQTEVFLVSNETVSFSTEPPAMTFELAASSYSMSETGKVAVVINRTGDTSSSGNVRLVPNPGTAAVPGDDQGDFRVIGATSPDHGLVVFFNPGETSKTVVVTGFDDDYQEGDEFFLLRLREPSTGAALGSIATATVTIVDDDLLPTVSFTQEEVFTYEKAGTVTVTLQRTGDLNQALLVGTLSDGGTANPDADFSAAFAGTQFNPGQATIPLTFNIADDMVSEGLEFFRHRLAPPGEFFSNYVVGSIPVVKVFISDEAQPSVEWVETVRYASEGDGNIALTAKRSGDLSRALDVPVTLTSAISSLRAPDDVILPPPYLYNQPNQVVLHFGEGENFASLIVTLVSNATIEPLEVGGFIILPGPLHTVGAQGTNFLYVVDQDGPPTIIFDRPELMVSEGAGPATLTLRRLGRLTDNLTVSFDSGTIGPGAATGDDYDIPASVNFPPGATTRAVPFTITDDLLVEPEEHTIIRINDVQPVGNSGSRDRVRITIRDNDAPAGAGLVASTFQQSRALPHASCVIIERNGALQPGLVQNLQVTGGTATGGEFSNLPSTVIIPPNVPAVPVPFTVTTGLCTATTSTIAFSISGDVTGPSTGVVNLTVDPCPPPPAFRFALSNLTVDESINFIPVIAVREGDASQADTVSVTWTPGTATAASDYFTGFSIFSFPAGATLATNLLTIFQDPVIEGNEDFTITLSSPSRGTVVAPAALPVTIIDDDHGAALARDDSVLVAAGSNLTFFVTLNDLPFDTNNLIVVSNSPATFGSLTIDSNGVATYIPFPGVTQAVDTVQYEVRGLTSSVTSVGNLFISILPEVPNRPPVSQDDQALCLSGGTVVINVTANDFDPDPADVLSVLSFSQPAEGSVRRTGIAGELLYEAPPGFTGRAEFFCTVTDGRGGVSACRVRIGVHGAGPGNRPPFAFDDAVRVCRPFAIFNPLLNDLDPDGNALAVDAIILFPTKGVLVALGGGAYRYTPNAGQVGEDSFTYRISDGNGGLAVARVVLTLNRPPVAVTDLVSTRRDRAVALNVLANDTDAENDVLNLIGIGPARFGNAVIIAAVPGVGNVRYTPPPGFSGVDTFTYRVSDGCDTRTGIVRVKVNHPPIAVNDFASVQPGQTIRLRPLANDHDPEGGPLIFAGLAAPLAGIAVQAGNVVTYTAPESFTGLDRFTYTVVDAEGDEAQATVFIGNEPLNTPPDANDDHFNLDPAVTNSLNAPVLANDSDADGDGLAITAHTAAMNGVVTNLVGAALRFTPNPGFSGIEKIAYTVTDGRGGADAAYLIVTVCPTNDPVNVAPTAVSDVASVADGSLVDIPVLDNDLDPDGPLLNLVSVGQPADGSAFPNGNQVRYIPNPGFLGIDCFTYTITDGAGHTAGGLVTVSVLPFPLPANTAPAAANDAVLALPNTVTLIEPLVNDSDADDDPLTLVSLTGPTNGTILPAGAGRLLYKPVAGYSGPDSVAYTISDGRGGTAAAVIQITVPGLFSFGRVTENGANCLQIVLPPYEPPLVLQTTTNLAPPVTWSFVTNTPTPPAEPLVLKFPFDKDQQYFRLVP